MLGSFFLKKQMKERRQGMWWRRCQAS